MSDETDKPDEEGGANPPPVPTEPEPATSDENNSQLPLVIGSIILVLTILAAVWWFLTPRDNRLDVWEEPSTAYEDADCTDRDDCETFTRVGGGHGSHGPESVYDFQYDPTIDDEIAQWGDCLNSIYVCIEAAMAEDADPATAVTSCVANSECPGECKDEFATRTSGAGFDRLETVFFDMFVDEGGICVPQEADE